MRFELNEYADLAFALDANGGYRFLATATGEVVREVRDLAGERGGDPRIRRHPGAHGVACLAALGHMLEDARSRLFVVQPLAVVAEDDGRQVPFERGEADARHQSASFREACSSSGVQW